jgi:hypothetical protein
MSRITISKEVGKNYKNTLFSAGISLLHWAIPDQLIPLSNLSFIQYSQIEMPLFEISILE